MSADPKSPIVIVGMACRVPGADNLSAFEDLLFDAKTGYGELPPERCDRSLYFDSRKGLTGKSYTTLGGIVPERKLNRDVCPLSPQLESLFDVAHVQFAEVAATAWHNATLVPNDRRLQRTGIYVGHSGGTRDGGGLSLGTQIEEAVSFVDDIAAFRQLPADVRREILAEVTEAIRRDRPSRKTGAVPIFHAYQAAALPARILGLTGTRSVIDGACASSLVALAQAILAIRAGRIDSAVVGGATYNNVDNLILFSHSQACTATDSRPFDDGASGLVSSEGYVAIVITTQEKAREHDLPVLGVIRGVGMSSDGKGRSLWAPRTEGQVLALQRAYSETPLLDIDYLEAHATSTQLGDATELETLRTLASESPVFSKTRTTQDRLLLGSVKSNIGHTLEAAGLIGLIKILIAMQQGKIPPSLRYEQPNRNYDWTTAPVRVVSQTEAWPDHARSHRPRRAAVSAFGIGGLNAHVIVEQPSCIVPSPPMLGEKVADRLDEGDDEYGHMPQKPLPLNRVSSFNSSLSTEPIAIVGRGIVVAGAANLKEFEALLNSDRSAISDAPADRWRKQAGVLIGETPQTWHAPHCRGGFITDFTFDGARYRIPPKQVQQANPVQMMLIDAVSQALDDVNSVGRHSTSEKLGTELNATQEPAWPMDRRRVGVVIGAIFGGEFGDQLQVGMRLPEICGHMTASMQRRGMSIELATQVSTKFRETVLKHRPALLDETGSFTASTLASRVAKTFDLMGGACALDSDDTSGLAALTVAADQLRAGICDLIICGTAQRSLSLSAFESLDLNDRLVRTGRPEDIPDDCRHILPGEGVSALLLCRLSDAEKHKLPVYGILGNIAQMASGKPDSTDEDGTTSSNPAAEVLTSADAEIVRRIGYLSGSHSLVRITAETLKTTSRSNSVTIAARSSDGVVLQTQLQTISPGQMKSEAITQEPTRSLNLQPSQIMPTETTDPVLRRFRFAATSGDSLLRLLRTSLGRAERLFAERDVRIQRDGSSLSDSAFQFATGDLFRSTILAASAAELRDRLAVAIKSAESGKFRALMDRDRVVLWHTHDETPRVAWLFPGQGSHYPDTPSVFSASEQARQTLATVDDLYAASNLPRLSTVFGNSAIKPGEDVWWAQAWVLGVTAALIDSLRAEGLRPDAVLGHSFGEFTASLASQVTTLPQTIELARHRANAVMSHMRTPGGLLSVRAAGHEVDWILKSAALPVYVTHLNSPKQTVIAGGRDEINVARGLLNRQGLAAVSIAVPAPFHTPLLAAAEVAFERMSASVLMRTPVCGFLSATSVQYLAEPAGIRNSLVRQLTQPVMYMPSIQRMIGEGFRVLLEVGPNDVLTRMNRDIVDSQAICLSLDVPGQPFAERMLLVHAVLECVANINAPRFPGLTDSGSNSARTPLVLGRNSVGNTTEIFDVTRSRRNLAPSIQPKTESGATTSVRDTNADGQAENSNVSDQRAWQGPSWQLETTPKTAAPVSDTQLRNFTKDLVVELTGYPPDIVDFEADLEADLGIDSIKKAQILGELGEWLGLTVRPDSLRLDSVRTLEDAVQVALMLARQKAAANKDASLPKTEDQPSGSSISNLPRFVEKSELPVEVAKTPYADRRDTVHRGTLPSNDRLDELLIDYVVDQTGYSRDIVDVDADLEADLGLDSIKLAQLIGEMREQFNLESLTLESIGQARFRTLREIREFLLSHASGSGPDAGLDASAYAGIENDSAAGNSHSPSSPKESVPQTFARRNIRPRTATASPENRELPIRGTESMIQMSSKWIEPTNGALQSPEHAIQAGFQMGQQHRTEIRSALRSMIHQPRSRVAQHGWTPLESALWKGVAAGAGVAEPSLRLAAALIREQQKPAISETIHSEASSTTETLLATGSSTSSDIRSSRQTHRYALRVIPAPRRVGMPVNPELSGAALILGASALAESLAERIRILGQTAIVLNTSLPMIEIEQTLTDLWQQIETPHLFLTMAFDDNSLKSLEPDNWKQRRTAALDVPFRICQRWMQRIIEVGRMEDASVVAVTQLGGDFGFSGQNVRSTEAIGGLVKAMLIEAWMRGFRTTPMKVIDVSSNLSSEEITRGVLQELAVPSYDMEIAFRGARESDESVGPGSDKVRNRGEAAGGSAALRPQPPFAALRPRPPMSAGTDRFCVQAYAAPLTGESYSDDPRNRIRRGGTWIVTGGGRGITAAVAMTLAKKYDLKLHLLGTAPVPNLSEDFVCRVTQDRSGIRRRIMEEASARGENPVEAWRNKEKAIEVDATLRSCEEKGIPATYHCCDVADFENVERTLREIRLKAGTIHGVIHGAGAGQDARFDRKRPDKVEKCLKAKIDGTLALIQATQQDPLEWFVTFGSISGRFGANGHTDYSLANDMMAKIVDRYRSERPEVCSVTFHWHAWGDIGMATKPEAKLALEMIDMEFMPACDGIDHFMRELEFGGDEPEVLITDENYFRKFFPADRLSARESEAEACALPLPLIPSVVIQQADGVCSSVVTLNPVSDRFLSQHRIQGRPTLPFVVALELMAEAVRARTGKSISGHCTNAEALQSIRFSTDDPLAVTVQTRPTSDGAIECRILADVRRRDGRLVEEDREYFRAVFHPDATLTHLDNRTRNFDVPESSAWNRVEYVAPDGLIYHGPELQELRKVADDGSVILGRIAASAPVQLFGGSRARGFTVPCSTMDACLYAVGYAAWHRHQKPSLPVRFGEIEFGRLPDPGEPCLVCIQQTHISESGATWNFQLFGHNGDQLLAATEYQIGWLKP